MNHSLLTSILGQGRWWYWLLLSSFSRTQFHYLRMLAKHDFQYVGIYTEFNNMFCLFHCKHTNTYRWLWKASGRRNWLSTVVACVSSWLWWLAGSHRTNQHEELGRATGCFLACKDRDRLFHWCYRRSYRTPPLPHKPSSLQPISRRKVSWDE
jgi:hypothetical protein